MEKLTEKQAEILECIKKFIASRGYPPTVREICKIKNIASPATVQVHLNKLQDKKYIKRDPKINRTIEILDNDYFYDDDLVKVPFINKNNFIEIPSTFVRRNKDYYAYIMENDLKEKNVLKNDILIIQRQKSFNINDIVVYMDDLGVKIEIASNTSKKDIVGKVTGLYRKM